MLNFAATMLAVAQTLIIYNTGNYYQSRLRTANVTSVNNPRRPLQSCTIDTQEFRQRFPREKHNVANEESYTVTAR